MDMILQTIDSALKNKGLSDTAASRLAVGHPSLIKNLRMPRDGEKRYNLFALIKLAEVLDLEFYFGPRRPRGGFSEAAALTDLSRVEALRGGYLPLPWHEKARRPGSAPFAVSRAWLADEGIVPDNLSAVVPDRIGPGIGLRGRVTAVVDTAAARSGPRAVWAVRAEGTISLVEAAFTARVTVLTGATDDGDPMVLFPADRPAVDFLGRLVWAGVEA